MFRGILQIFLFCFPWSIRRKCLNVLLGYNISKTAHIGKSIILAQKLILEDNAHIGSGTLCKPIDCLVMHKNSNLGNFNFITGVNTSRRNSEHFAFIPNRKCELIIGSETGITSRHYFDCTAGIYIGDYCQIAGFGSTFLTHSIDIKENRQDAQSIRIGNYCFIGLRSTILKGTSIADRIALGACSLVSSNLEKSESLYAGIPAKHVKDLKSYKFFFRNKGEVI